MVVFDLAGKSCEIIKMSAPATFILRQAHAHWISGKSLPMGAVSKATPFYARREVEVGDYVVMVSDGISDCFTSNRELGQWMLGIYQQDPSVDLMSQRILKEAKSIACLLYTSHQMVTSRRIMDWIKENNVELITYYDLV